MNPIKNQRQYNWRKIGFILWSMLFMLLLALHFYPIRFTMLRLTMIVLVALLWGGAVLWSWDKKWAKRALLTSSLLLILCAFFPSRPDNPQLLRKEYVRSLLVYEDVSYVWGGENKRGIDCSGLMRAGLIDANFKRGRMTLNPSLVREAFSLWWHDSSAKALKEEHRGRTRLILIAPSINAVNYSAIHPGDMAVTSSGVHVLAYVGDKTWIEADPNAVQGDKVIQVTTPTRNAWFHMPVHIMRWRQLEETRE